MTMYAGDEMLSADDEAFGPFADEEWFGDYDEESFSIGSVDVTVPAAFLAVGDEFWSDSLQDYATALEVLEVNGRIMVKDDHYPRSYHVYTPQFPVRIKVEGSPHI